MRAPCGVLWSLAAVGLIGMAGCATDSVLDLEVGDCLHQSDLDGGEVTSAPTVPCAEEHDTEIFADHVFAGGEYPGADAVAEQSDAACREQFEDFIGLPYEESTISFTMLYPSEQSWEAADDRTTLCLAVTDEPVTGSLEGAQV